MKPQVYKNERPTEYFTRFHTRTRTKDPDLMYEVVRLVLTPILLIFFRTRCIDSHKIPPKGPVIVAPNHFSFMDHFLISIYMRHKVHFVAKSQLFKRPLQFIYTHGDVFPVRRGHHNEEMFKTAHSMLSRNHVVMIYAEGERSRTGELNQTKPNINRLALETSATVVPAAIAGSENARNWKRLRFPKVTVQYGDPITFGAIIESPTREQSQATTDAIFERTQKLFYGLKRQDRHNAIQAARQTAREARKATRGVASRTPAS